MMESIISPWCRQRTGTVDRITVHHTAAVGVSARQIAQTFTGSRRASANWCIGTDGSVAVSVPEELMAFTSGSSANDNRAVTIECGNSSGPPWWAVSAATWDTLVQLCVEICRRYGKRRLLWLPREQALSYSAPGDMVLTVHQWLDRTSCPGPYLMQHMPDLAEIVSAELEKEEDMQRYDRYEDLPSWARPTIERLLESGSLRGTGSGLDLSEDMLRLLVILDREGVFGHE